MQIESRQEGGYLVITPLDARVDVAVAPAFRTALVDRIDQGYRRLIVNLERVQTVDSSFLGALVSALQRLGCDGELKVCSLNRSARAMFERTNLHRVIPVVEVEGADRGGRPADEEAC
jgi:anti-sigma B factor antagonist